MFFSPFVAADALRKGCPPVFPMSKVAKMRRINNCRNGQISAVWNIPPGSPFFGCLSQYVYNYMFTVYIGSPGKGKTEYVRCIGGCAATAIRSSIAAIWTSKKSRVGCRFRQIGAISPDFARPVPGFAGRNSGGRYFSLFPFCRNGVLRAGIGAFRIKRQIRLAVKGHIELFFGITERLLGSGGVLYPMKKPYLCPVAICLKGKIGKPAFRRAGTAEKNIFNLIAHDLEK